MKKCQSKIIIKELKMIEETLIHSISKENDDTYMITETIGENGFVLYDLDWRRVPRYNSKCEKMSNEEFMKKIVNKHGLVYFNQNYANEVLGSSHTLISANKLSEMQFEQPEEIKDGKLNIYKYPIPKHKYIMSVDPSKDGKDAFAVQILDITNARFEQVASACLQIDYLLMPEFLNEWCEFYNFAYLVIEQNEGAGQSIADQMYQTFEYENLHFDKDSITNKRKKYPGTRTTSKSRKQILQTLKIFIENDKLNVVDKTTINEFMQFILIKNKYQADDGAHDDMIMSLALAFTPFNNIKNFENMQQVINFIFKTETKENKTDFVELLTIGNFDQGLDEDYEEEKTYLTIEEFMQDPMSNGFV